MGKKTSRRSPHAPRGYDPTQQAGCPVRSLRQPYYSTPAGAGNPGPLNPGLRASGPGLRPRPEGLGWAGRARAGRRAGWSRPPWLRPPHRPGRRAVRQLEQVNIRTGWAEAQTGPYRPYVKDTKKETARDREKGDETEREREM